MAVSDNTGFPWQCRQLVVNKGENRLAVANMSVPIYSLFIKPDESGIAIKQSRLEMLFRKISSFYSTCHYIEKEKAVITTPIKLFIQPLFHKLFCIHQVGLPPNFPR